ncbi:unnamed protein product [Meganyctiphanes norvegica]|uniref:Uncharacterized protein n=1 Tax=Meganyctiphanes norvegica TaxID=48144 RepID=A0AAV2PQ73_MEGNR
MGAAGSHFVIKHTETEKFIHILNNTISCNQSPLVFNKGVHDRMTFEFEVSEDDDEYGYIKHVASGKYVHPFGGSEEPELNTPLVIYDDKHDGCLFNIDQETGLIKHKGGLYVNPALHHQRPRKNVWLVLHEDTSERSNFMFVDPNDTDSEIDIPCDSDSGED